MAQTVRQGSTLAVYAHASILLNLFFAFALSRLGGFQDSHYVVLMVVPVLAAAFRYRPVGVALVTAAAVALTFLEIWLYFRARSGPAGATEAFEAANVALIYVVVALVVAVLARQGRADQAALEANLEELRQTRDRLTAEEKLAAVGRLASGIAHEIRNPVSMILSSVAMSRSGGGLPREELDAIVTQEAERLERLTSDFLRYACERPPARRPTALPVALGYVAGLVQARCAEAGVELVVGCDPELAASVDSFQIHQALLNLILNAVDATPRGGTVRLQAQAAGVDVGLAVENSGAAIPEAAVARLFEPFFSTKPAGTGLGLAIEPQHRPRPRRRLGLAVNSAGRVRFDLTLPGARCAVPDPPLILCRTRPEPDPRGPHPDRRRRGEPPPHPRRDAARRAARDDRGRRAGAGARRSARRQARRRHHRPEDAATAKGWSWWLPAARRTPACRSSSSPPSPRWSWRSRPCAGAPSTSWPSRSCRSRCARWCAGPPSAPSCCARTSGCGAAPGASAARSAS